MLFSFLGLWILSQRIENSLKMSVRMSDCEDRSMAWVDLIRDRLDLNRLQNELRDPDRTERHVARFHGRRTATAAAESLPVRCGIFRQEPAGVDRNWTLFRQFRRSDVRRRGGRRRGRWAGSVRVPAKDGQTEPLRTSTFRLGWAIRPGSRQRRRRRQARQTGRCCIRRTTCNAWGLKEAVGGIIDLQVARTGTDEWRHWRHVRKESGRPAITWSNRTTTAIISTSSRAGYSTWWWRPTPTDRSAFIVSKKPEVSANWRSCTTCLVRPPSWRPRLERFGQWTGTRSGASSWKAHSGSGKCTNACWKRYRCCCRSTTTNAWISPTLSLPLCSKMAPA